MTINDESVKPRRSKRSPGFPPTTSTTRNKYRITTKVTAKTSRREHTHVQTDQFLEDLSGDLSPEEVDATVQTDPSSITTSKLGQSSSPSPPFRTGVDASTQILPGELYSFEEEVQPVVEALVAKVMQMVGS